MFSADFVLFGTNLIAGFRTWCWQNKIGSFKFNVECFYVKESLVLMIFKYFARVSKVN